jgi:hypothetical protein
MLKAIMIATKALADDGRTLRIVKTAKAAIG